MPPSHEGGLAVSGRCGHDNDRKDAVQHVAGRIKPRPGQRVSRPGGGKQLALDYRVQVSFAVHTVASVVRVVVISDLSNHLTLDRCNPKRCRARLTPSTRPGRAKDGRQQPKYPESASADGKPSTRCSPRGRPALSPWGPAIPLPAPTPPPPLVTPPS